MKKILNISKDLSLPLESTTQKMAWLGVTGSGKTYGASKYSEELWEKGAQFVVIDPVGVWYGLRLAQDGKKPNNINIPIFGGLHGDVPLEPTGGQLIANLIVDKGLSCIIDVSQFEHDTDKAKFAKDFADKLFFRKKSSPSALHLFLEECQEFVPQNPQRGEEGMLHAFIRMQKLGRNFGIGSSYISQRPQEVNKKALNMCQTLFVFRTTGTHERNAIEKWIEDKSLDETIAQDLPKIPTGSCHVWSPEFLKVSKMVHISEKKTFNASATPEVGAVAKVRHLAPIELDKIRTEMAATIEKAKGEDPKLLQKKVRELEAQLKRPQQNHISQPAKMVPDTKAIEKSVNEALISHNKKWNSHANEINKQIRSIATTLAKAKIMIPDTLPIFEFSGNDIFKITQPQNVYKNKYEHIPADTVLIKKENQNKAADIFNMPELRDGETKPLSKCARSILAYLQSRYPDHKTMAQMWIATGYAPGGTFRSCIYELTGQNLIKKTDQGYEAYQHSNEEFDTSFSKWDGKLSLCARKIFHLLLEDSNIVMNKDELAEKTGYQMGGTFRSCIYELTGPELIIKTSGGYKVNPEALEA